MVHTHSPPDKYSDPAAWLDEGPGFRDGGVSPAAEAKSSSTSPNRPSGCPRAGRFRVLNCKLHRCVYRQRHLRPNTRGSWGKSSTEGCSVTRCPQAAVERQHDLVKAMGIDGISKSEVSRMAKELDKVVTEFKERPLDQGPYRYLWIDALTQRCPRRGPGGQRLGRHRHRRGRRGPARDRRPRHRHDRGHGCVDGVLRALVARGLSGVELVISDAHGGIKAAISQVFSEASWQRRRTHFMANLASRCAKGNWPMIATLVRSIFEQPDRASGRRACAGDCGLLDSWSQSLALWSLQC